MELSIQTHTHCITAYNHCVYVDINFLFFVRYSVILWAYSTCTNEPTGEHLYAKHVLGGDTDWGFIGWGSFRGYDWIACGTSGGARTGWRFPCMQISPSIATEAFQAAALSPVIGGPVYRTVAKRNGRQSTFVHVQGAHSTREAKLQTTIVHYRNCEGRLHPVTAHPRKVTYNQ